MRNSMGSHNFTMGHIIPEHNRLEVTKRTQSTDDNKFKHQFNQNA